MHFSRLQNLKQTASKGAVEVVCLAKGKLILVSVSIVHFIDIVLYIGVLASSNLIVTPPSIARLPKECSCQYYMVYIPYSPAYNPRGLYPNKSPKKIIINENRVHLQAPGLISEQGLCPDTSPGGYMRKCIRM